MSDLRRFFKRAAERSADEVIQHRGSPDPRDFRSPALLFARCLKGRPEFSGLDSESATALIDEELDSMFPDLPAPWVALGLPDFDSREEQCDPRTDFITVWDEISTPFKPGSRVHEAAKLAGEKPLDFNGRFRAADATLERLLSVCYWLGQPAKNGEFFLSCRDAGDVLGVSATTASQLLRRAEKLEFLAPVGEYSPKDRGRRHAKAWRFIGGGEVSSVGATGPADGVPALDGNGSGPAAGGDAEGTRREGGMRGPRRTAR